MSSIPLCARDVDAQIPREGVARLSAPEPASEETTTPSVTQQPWDIGLGYAFVRFNSSLFTASTSGLLTSVGYHLNDHFALEGQITSTMGDPKPGPFDAKYRFYGGGAALNGRIRRTRPFLHGLIGGLHMFPQTQFSNNSIAALAGCGVDVRWKSEIWIRFESDYVRSQLYRAAQNNLQLAMTVHFTF